MRYYAAIVDAGSLSAAGRQLGVTKSLLSQHLNRLEQTLGVCLIQRTTRRMQVTPLGLAFHQHCQLVLEEVARARAMIEEARDAPRGRLKILCPVLFAQRVLMPLVPSFLREYPEVELVLDADYRDDQDIDLISEGYDLVLEIRRQIEDSRSIVRAFTLDRHWLTASPELVHALGAPQTPAELEGVASVALQVSGDNHAAWQLFDADETACTINHRPRLVCSDPLIAMDAAIAGTGVALLPTSLCMAQIAQGRLLRLLPGHQGGTMHLYATYPSRHGLSRAARCFLDHLSEGLPSQIRHAVGDAPAPSRMQLTRD